MLETFHNPAVKKLALSTGLVTALIALLATGSIAYAHVSAVTIDSTATLSPGRTLVTVTGTMTCTAGHPDGVVAQVEVFQGTATASSIGEVFVPCTGNPEPWQTTAGIPFGGKTFHPGKASIRVSAGSVDPSETDLTNCCPLTDAIVTLKP